MNDKMVRQLYKWMVERHSIYLKKFNNEPKPWTKDKILQQYRFCNVYRELDTVTQWITKNWRTPYRGDRHLWFALVVARLLNLPGSLAWYGWPVPWNAKRFSQLEERMMQSPVFNGAYIVSTNGHNMKKIPYLIKYVLDPLWKDRENIAAVINNETLGTLPPPTLAEVHTLLCRYNGLGSFMAAQVIADLKYGLALRKAADWDTWAASGPGSRRGLNRVCGIDARAGFPEKSWFAQLQVLHTRINKMISDDADTDLSLIHAQDLQNCLCEFDKYERVRLGEGTPKQRYQGV